MRGVLVLAAALAGCALDPDEELAAADLRVRVDAIRAGTEEVVARLVDGDGRPLDERAAEAEAPSLTLYFLDAPATARAVQVEGRIGGVAVQCIERTLPAGGRTVDAPLADGCDDVATPDASPPDDDDAGGSGRPPGAGCSDERGGGRDREPSQGSGSKPENPKPPCKDE